MTKRLEEAASRHVSSDAYPANRKSIDAADVPRGIVGRTSTEGRSLFVFTFAGFAAFSDSTGFDGSAKSPAGSNRLRACARRSEHLPDSLRSRTVVAWKCTSRRKRPRN